MKRLLMLPVLALLLAACGQIPGDDGGDWKVVACQYLNAAQLANWSHARAKSQKVLQYSLVGSYPQIFLTDPAKALECIAKVE